MVIAQFGYFDIENYGDLLFPEILRHEIISRSLNIKVDLFSNNGGRVPMGSNTIVYPAADLPQMHMQQRYDAIVIGGGEIIRFDMNLITDENNYKNPNTLLPWLYPVLFAYANQIPVLFNCPGVPFAFNMEQIPQVKLLLDGINYCSVRDSGSKRLLEGCGVTCPITVSPDTAFIADTLYSEEELEEAFNQVKTFSENLHKRNYVIFQFNSFDPVRFWPSTGAKRKKY